MSSKKVKAEERAQRAAAAREVQRKAEKRRNLLVGLAVAVVIVVIIGGGFLINKLGDDSDDVSTGRDSEHSLGIGDPDAPHSIVIYEDFICPICGQLEAASHEKLAALAEEGKVYLSYRPFNLFTAETGLPAAQVAYSIASANAFAVVQDKAGDDVAKKFHDLLYANQPEETGPYLTNDQLVQYAVEAGATEADVRPGIEDLSEKEWVDGANAAAAKAGVSGTPTILLDGEVYQDGATFEDLANNLVEAVQ